MGAPPPQLRQRAAWALSQIFSVGAMNFGYESDTELWAHYYDTFVEHAFGNYRDVMREVSASPLMGRYLTLMGNAAKHASGNEQLRASTSFWAHLRTCLAYCPALQAPQAPPLSRAARCHRL